MQNPKPVIATIAMIIALFFLTAAGQEKAPAQDPDISCIQTFRDAMVPSWQKYMPAKDYATVRKHIPNMLAEAERIAELKLDSTYAEVAEEFQTKREAFLLAILDLKKAADSTDDAGLEKALDKTHLAFSQMASVLALMPQEVKDFHEIIADIWHEYLPAKDYDAIKKSIPSLREGCAKMKAAKLHESKQAVSEQYLAAIGETETSITGVEKVIDSKSDEKISEAVSTLHESFRTIMGLF